MSCTVCTEGRSFSPPPLAPDDVGRGFAKESITLSLSFFPPPQDGVRNNNETYALPLGPLPPLQDKVKELGYPVGGISCA
jgi:hypothetical protein